MPALPVVPNCLGVTLYYDVYGNPAVQNKLYFKYGGVCSSADLATLANTIMTNWGTYMAPETSQFTSLIGVECNDLASKTGAVASSTHASIPGTVGTTVLSDGAAFVMSNKGGTKYRGGHSRLYLPGMVGANLTDGNTWTQTFQTALLTAWSAFVSKAIQLAPTAINLLWQAIVHRFGASAGAPVEALGRSGTRSVPLTNPVVEQVLALETNPQVGSQRRRNQQLD